MKVTCDIWKKKKNKGLRPFCFFFQSPPGRGGRVAEKKSLSSPSEVHKKKVTAASKLMIKFHQSQMNIISVNSAKIHTFHRFCKIWCLNFEVPSTDQLENIFLWYKIYFLQLLYNFKIYIDYLNQQLICEVIFASKCMFT